MDEMEMLFSGLDEQNIEMLLKNIDTPEDPVLSAAIKSRLGIQEKTKIRSFPIKAVLPFAAMFCVVLACTLVFTLNNSANPFTPKQTTVPSTTQSPPVDNPLMVAISSGNEDIIPRLLEIPGIVTKETLDFALNFSNLLSYETLHRIALSVRDSLGSTGLDGLVEAALLGDSATALEELGKKEEVLMTPFEKLAFFFSVAFCNSEVVEEFVNRGYDINAKDSSGNSIYAIAEKYGNEDTMQYAISMGITS